ncbi:MAG: gliding motility-associated C-terminal domain-containing protein, partial [Cryomorphaceae bacterium]|nr:gliding motility-associated C-terminal domain-containing protein [Cryomorphaceae bacterium]
VSDGNTCPQVITRSYTVTDDCGNSITVQQTITVDDTTPPTASDLPSVTVIYSSDIPTPDINLVNDESDNCTVTPVVNYVGDVSDGNSCPETFTRIYVITDDCGNSTTVTQTIVVTPMPSSPVVSNDSTYCDSWILVEMTASGDGGVLTWYDEPTLSSAIGNGESHLPEDQLGIHTYYVTQSIENCESPPTMVQITIEACDIVVPTAFTPNGDATNDYWELVNIDAFPNSAIQVFNRWGGLLYQAKGDSYNLDPWNGTYNGEALPVGSYYYIIDLGVDNKIKKGTVSIILD